jgi:soluble cytochrome b562
VQREQEQRAAAFQRLVDERPKAARQAVERRLSAVSERAQRRQALQLEAQRHRENVQQQQYEQNQMMMERQHGLSEWLKSLDEQKRNMLWQRRVDGVASSLQRQTILQTTRDAWHETLRATPLPDDPQELRELAVRITSK